MQAATVTSTRLHAQLCSCVCMHSPASSISRRSDWRRAKASSPSSSVTWRGFQSTSSQALWPSSSGIASIKVSSKRHASSDTAVPAPPPPSPSQPLSTFFKQSFLRPTSEKSGTSTAAGRAQRDRADASSQDPTLDLQAQDAAPHAFPHKSTAVSIPPIATPTDAWRPLPSTIGNRSLASSLTIYKQLAKGRLSAWIVLTAMAGYAMCPTDPAAAQLAMDALVSDTFGSSALGSALSSVSPSEAALSSASSASSSSSAATVINDFRVTTLLATAAGTALCSASANTFNQLVEIPYDAQMPRTAKRPLPSHAITPLHAFTFGSLTGISGVALLAACVNPLTASLGLLNIVLYAGVYTPLKRLSVLNTWIGALVGGIPPLMGWAACTNSLDPFSGQAGAWVLAAILFAWQFPHFNSLSWTIRSEYARGGYRMLSAVNPAMNARVSLRWTVAGALAAGVAAPMVGLTSWAVGLATLVPSGALGFYAYRFWRAGSRSALERARQVGIMKAVPGARATDKDPRDASARSLFFVSLVHLPALLFMMMAGKIWGDYQERKDVAGIEGTLQPLRQ